MSTFKNLKFRTKILLLGIGSVLITILALVATVVWQSAQFNALARDQFQQSAEADLSHIAKGVYNTVQAQDEAVQQLVNSSLHVADLVMHNTGQVKLADEKIDWQAVNEATQHSIDIQLPKMYVGDTWLGQYTHQYDTTPIVDHVQMIAGGTATIFQRMNEQGDMLRVATNILLPNKQRALGTYIPAVRPDGSPDPVISAILRGSIYRGSAFAVDAWYDAAYEPIRDQSGQIIGMLYVGVKQESVESIRQAILRTQVGQTGYVYVLGGTGNELGHYIISQKGQRDGENIWNAQDAEGHLIIQSIINKAVTLKFGETATAPYQWQDPGDPAPRGKIASFTYYEPWHWVIVANIDESEIQAYRLILENGQTRMIVVAGVVGLALALVAGFLSVLLARSITRPVDHLAGIATQVSAGNLEVVAKVEQRDEIGTLATTFNSMTTQLRDMINSLETRVELRTAQIQASADVGRVAASILDPDQLLDQTVQLIVDRFGFYYAAAFTIDPHGKWAVLRAAKGPGEAAQVLKQVGHRLELDGNSMVAAAMRRRRPRVALDVGDEPVRFANPLLPDTRSEIALPLVVGEEVLGALDVQSVQAGAFDEANTTTLQAMADQIAVALNNAHQYRHEQAHARQTTSLVEAAVELATLTEADDAQARVLDLTLALLNADGAALWSPIEQTDQLVIVKASGANLETVVGRRVSRDRGMVGEAFASNTTLRLDPERAQRESWLPQLKNEVQAILAIPLSWRGRAVGVMTVIHISAKAFTDDDANVAQLFAAQAAATLENARLFSQVQEALEELSVANKRLTGEAWQAHLRGESVAHEYRSYAAAAVEPVSLALHVPVELRGQPIGLVTLEDNQPQRELTDDERSIVENVVQQMALALESARLFEQTQSALGEARRLAQRERLINRIVGQLRDAVSVDEVLRIATNEMRQAVRATYATTKLTAPDSNGNERGHEHDSK